MTTNNKFSASPPLCENNSGYESRRLLDQYLLFHYGTPEQILAGSSLFKAAEAKGLDFPTATVWGTLILNLINENSESPLRALDIGCAVGRSSFELSRLCTEVVAMDYSAAFIQAAKQMQTDQLMTAQRYNEGQQTTELELACPDKMNPERVKFEIGDAMNLRDDLGQFDIVHAANLLCRLNAPERFLRRLPSLLKTGGQLVMATPCSWSEEFTPKKNQPEGSTLDFLHSHLDETFELKREIELPFVIRDHARKFQISTSQTTLWVRK